MSEDRSEIGMLPLQSEHTSSSSQPEFGRDGKRLDELRRTIARMQAPAVAFDAPGDIPLGVAEVDRALGGGLARGALHEIAACGETHIAAATGFALGLAAQSQAVVWVAEDMALLESGAPYGPGLDLFGLRPERLLTVAGSKAGDVLWAMEEALRCRAVGAVIGEVRNASRALDLVATRRLSLAASAHGATALLLRTEPGTEASAAATRWEVEAASPPHSAFGRGVSGIGPPRFALTLTRNRRGPLGTWMLEWSVSDVSFVLATHPQPMAGTAVDRPHRARAA
jgi:protein ImuA